ncbi:hypothetical protein BASA61_000125 [Batrachochytrium salamandrivorans]|nr:hypothetical protein BASA61_000125 [Batrachochytrium salamandrivorans]KAH6585322.1 hypothetical protein BASA60_000611 [Batrachochytrium salamandrivorans]
MKLISLAVVSLLAITVSAQSPHGSNTQNVQQHQDTSTQNAHQPGQDSFQTELDKLEEDHTKAQMWIYRIGSGISAMMKEKLNLELEMRKIKEMIKSGISESKKRELTEYSIDEHRRHKSICADIKIQRGKFRDAKKARDDIRTAIYALLATQK